MNKLINSFKTKPLRICTIITIVIVTIIAIYIISDTYASGAYTIIFNRAEDTEVMKTCKTDASGKLDDDCIDTISKICRKWSSESWDEEHDQENQIKVDNFKDMIFTEDKEYYCVAHTSVPDYDMGCYVCKNDNNIMKWKTDTESDQDCSGGYTKSTTITNEANCISIIPDSCYVCKNNNNIMKWDNNDDKDSNCTEGYTPIDKPQNECKTIIPDSCYVCKNNNNIMKWDNNGNKDNDCTEGYTPIDKPQNECKTIIPNACYVCKNDNNIMKWQNNGNKDINCSSGYTKLDGKTEAECVPVENPKTGNILIFTVWIIGICSICYSVYYFKQIKNKA